MKPFKFILTLAFLFPALMGVCGEDFATTLQKAKDGDAASQNNVGDAYYNGKGVSKDYKKAFEWFRKAAEQGYEYGCYNVGHAYETGNGVKQDYSQAFKWYLKAAEQGFAKAQYAIGRLYDLGLGVTQDYSQAFKWYLKAANQGHPIAQEQVGLSYDFEYGVPEDNVKAVEWYRKAAEQGSARGQFFLGSMYETGEGIDRDYKQAYYWHKKSAEQGYDAAQHYLGELYEFGRGVTRDYSQAFYWYHKAADQGYDIAQYRLGLLYEKGLGVAKNYTEALRWYEKSAKKGYDKAQEKYDALSAWLADVDNSIPKTNAKNANTFVVIIANEHYDESEHISHVPFAINDGKMFRQYCEQVLGVPENNIREVYDATNGKMKRQINWLAEVAQEFTNPNIIFYYSGHGMPDEKNNTSYILPVDGFLSDVSTCYKLDDLYTTLGAMPAVHITVFIDACFSGSNRGSGSLAKNAKGVACKALPGSPKGNMVVFSAAQGDETAYPYEAKQHGMFTYYLLKKLQETKGDVTLQELGDYITTNVKQQSLTANSKKQTPSVRASDAIGSNWKNWKLK